MVITRLFLALIAPIIGTGGCPAAAAQGVPDLNGIWKLVAHSTEDQEWAIFEIKQADGKPIVEMIDAPKVFGKPQIYLAKSPDALVVLLAFELSEITFKGRLHAGGVDGRIVGAFQIRMTGHAWTSGARLEKTRAMKVTEAKEPPAKPSAMSTVGILLDMRKATAEFLDDRYMTAIGRCWTRSSSLSTDDRSFPYPMAGDGSRRHRFHDLGLSCRRFGASRMIAQRGAGG